MEVFKRVNKELAVLKIAVIILNWNGLKYLELFIPSVLKYSNLTDTRVIVADNHSSDNSVGFLKSNYPEIEVLEFNKNYGFAGGYGKALSCIEAKYYVLSNSDVEVTKNWLRPLTLNFRGA